MPATWKHSGSARPILSRLSASSGKRIWNGKNMAKFEIEAKIGANSAEFESKLKHASKESREFAKSDHENMSQAKEIFGEVAGEAGLGKIVKGLGSASAAAAAFGAAMVASVAEGLKE